MRKRNKLNKQSVAQKVLRFALLVVLAIGLVVSSSCSAEDATPEVLHWQQLGESPHRSIVNRLLKGDLQSAIKFGWDPARKYYVAAKDINDDGLDELFVTTGIPSVSGVEGSWIGIYSPDANGGWHNIPYYFISHYSPRILSTKTNGFHDLAAWNSIVSYGDGAYRRTGDTDFAKIELGKEHSIENLLPHIWEQCCSEKE